jgi:lipopolysaccharide biosynthesis glycosyltransferase
VSTAALRENVVVLCTDANFLLPCAFLADQLMADPQGDEYDIAIVHDGVDQASLRHLAERAKRPMILVAFDRATAGLRTTELVSRATYIRLFLEELLPPHYRRILYVDSDVYLERPEIAALFGADLGGSAFAAVEDSWLRAELSCPDVLPPAIAGWREWKGVRPYKANLGLDAAAPYFNAGVLLIDRARWAAADLSARALAFAQAHPDRCLFADQSALNAVAGGHWSDLSPRYNYQSVHGLADLARIIRPVLWHFAGPYKPWNSTLWGEQFTRAYSDWHRRSGWRAAFPGGPSAIEAPVRPSLWARLAVMRRRIFARTAASAAQAPTRLAALRSSVAGIVATRRFIDLDPADQRALVTAISG